MTDFSTLLTEFSTFSTETVCNHRPQAVEKSVEKVKKPYAKGCVSVNNGKLQTVYNGQIEQN